MRSVIVFLIRIYQSLNKFRPRVCRYEPSCSEYMIQAVLKYGAIKGVGKGLLRICRCHPWSPGGFDPVK